MKRRTRSFVEHRAKTVPRYAATYPREQAQKQVQNYPRAVLEPPTSVPKHLPSTFLEREANKTKFPGYVPPSTCQKSNPKGLEKELWTTPNAPDRSKRAIERRLGAGELGKPNF